MDVFQATPVIEPDEALRTEIVAIVAEVARCKELAAKQQKDVDDLMAKAGGKSFEQLEEVKKNHERLIKDFNKNRKKAFADFGMAWKGICPGCKECKPGKGHVRNLPQRHSIGSMDCKPEALIMETFSKSVVELNQTISALGDLGQETEGSEAL